MTTTNDKGRPAPFSLEQLIENVWSGRNDLFRQLCGPRGDVDQACNYPDQILADMYRAMYDRNGIAERVCNVWPLESWQVTPSVYEDESSTKATPFEEAWDNLGRQLHGGEKSWYQDEQGSLIWSYLLRGDVQSGIGVYGVILLGLDDGLLLEQPAWGTPPDGYSVKDISGVSEIQSGDGIGTASQRGGNQGVGGDPGQFKGIYGDVPASDDQLPKDVYGGTLPPNMRAPYMSTMGTDAQYFGTQFSPMNPPKPPPSSSSGSDLKGDAAKGSRSTGVPERRLLFLRVFDESLVQVVQYEASVRNSRFGQPIMYRITLNDPRTPHTGIGLPLATVRVHWSRVIHLADNLGPSEIFGVPRQRPVWNRLLDLDRFYGGSAQMYWQGAFPGLSLETNPQLGGDVIIDKDKVTQMMQDYAAGVGDHGSLARWLLLVGIQAKSLAPQVVDPSPQIASQLEAICIELKVPVRVFKGSERGELASSQDDSAWNDRLKNRQYLYLNPKVLAPFIDRLIMLGVLPEPEGYSVQWPDLDSNTDVQKAGIALQKTQAVAAYVAGNVESLIPPADYLVRVLGFDEEEVEEMLAAAEEAQEEKQQEQQDLADQHGLVPQVPGFEQPQPEKVVVGAGGNGQGGPAGKPSQGQKPTAKPGSAAPPPKPPTQNVDEQVRELGQWRDWFHATDQVNEWQLVRNHAVGNLAGALHLAQGIEWARVVSFSQEEETVENAFCATGPGGGINPHCSPGHTLQPKTNLPVGMSFTKIHRGSPWDVEITSSGIKLTDATGVVSHHSSLSSAAKHVQGHKGAVNGWAFFKISKPTAATPGTPVTPAHAAANIPVPNPSPTPTPIPPAVTPTPAPTPTPVAATPTPAVTPAPGGVHAASGLPIGTIYTKRYNGVTHTVEVTSVGFKVTGLAGAVTMHSSLTAAAKAIRGSNTPINGRAFFGAPSTVASVPAPAPTPAPVVTPPVATPAAAPAPATPAPVVAPPPSPVASPAPVPPAASPGVFVLDPSHMVNPPSALPVVPMVNKITFETGKHEPGTLNGVDFTQAPKNFWEKTQDVTSFKEPPPTNGRIARAGVMVMEPDGRVWIASPTNSYGDRKHTLPGGGVEHGLSNQQNALKEVWEETGLQVEITGHLGDFRDSNNGNIGRMYIGRRIGGRPSDAKIEDGSHIDPNTGRPVVIRYKPGEGIHDPSKNGQFAAESSHVHLVTTEEAAKMLHRTDDLAQLATVAPIPIGTKTNPGNKQGDMMEKLIGGLQPAIKEYVKDKDTRKVYPGNETLHAVQELRGFNALPKVVSKVEMDDLIKKGGHVEMLRSISSVSGFGSSKAVTGKELAEQFKSGEHFPGHGIFGAGTYADSNKGAKNVVNQGLYGASRPDSGVIRMALAKDAKIITEKELRDKVPKCPPGYRTRGGNGTNEEEWMGVQAALAGYDAIVKQDYQPANGHHDYGNGFYVILNRGALVVQKEDGRGHTIQ